MTVLTIGQKQRIFPKLVSILILYAYDSGYELAFGEVQRSPEEAMRLATLGKGISNSLHPLCLAVDLKLFKDGKYLTDSAAYEPLGKYWESLSSPAYKCTWGGRFKKPDGNHFSMEHNGVR